MDFIYPFLKNYFDNIDKFNISNARVNDYTGGITADAKRFFSQHGISLLDSFGRATRRTFGTSDQNPKVRYSQLTSDIKAQ